MNTDNIKVYIVDDHQMVIDGIRMMIEGQAGFSIMGETTNPEEVTEKLKDLEVDILITDVGMSGMTGVELSRIVRRQFPNIKILALSMFSDSHIVAEMIDAGISGYILKNAGKKELIEALHKVAIGEKYFGQEITMQFMKSFQRGKEDMHLTDREIEIIRLIEKDLSTSQIAECLFISERTVETHRKNILHKTNTRTVVGLLKYAYDRKII
ncbi:MAG: response regulator transcription factor [Pedobacter sp.]|nr:MAG: response regulator transcription factor [Pedobacter sp.]